jgi:nicotinate-nucleotide adenylyltransferase
MRRVEKKRSREGVTARLGLFGGSFNPIHLGHLIVARAVAEQLNLDRVVLLPSASPPHKTANDLLMAEDRARLVRLAIAGDPLFEFDEFDLTRPGPTYTIETIEHFQAIYSQAELHWIIGADSLLELPTWRQAAELVDACRIVTAARPGHDHFPEEVLRRAFREDQVHRLKTDWLETPRIDISSTQIRERLRHGRSIRYLVPESVERNIAAGKLYS